MLNAHHKWKYFEPIGIEPVPPNSANETPHHSSAIISTMRQEIQILRRSLDLVLDENERLYLAHRNRRMDVSVEMPRTKVQASAEGEVRPQERTKLDRAVSSQGLRGGVGKNSREEAQPIDVVPVGTPRTEPSIDALSRVVVRWIFPAASEPRVRLVAAAIRNRLTTEK